MTLNVIGTGFGRTGTESMRQALNMLGLGPTHHMHEVMDNETQIGHWRALAKGASPDWEVVLDGFSACVDWPSAHFWPELVAAYPDARVILTWREPESWWRSYARTIMPVLQRREPDTVGTDLLADRALGGRPDDKAHVLANYRANIDRVLAEVPADRLLVHRLGDGWPSLCAHLGVPVPDAPYPRSNTTAEFNIARNRDRV